MNIELFLPLIFLGLFFIVRWTLSLTLLPLLKYLLNGPFSQYYKRFAKEQFEFAARQNNSERAWEEIALAKIREMSNPRITYGKRKQNLEYIRNIVHTRRIANSLIDVLPLQRDINFQKELARLISEILEKIAKEKTIDTTEIESDTSSLNAPLVALNELFSAWLTSGILLILFWGRLDNYSPSIIILLCLIVFAFTSLPILNFNLKPSNVLAYVSFSAFTILTTLALYANVNHSSITSMETNLSNIGYPGTTLRISYPKWIRYDNSQDCQKLSAISIFIEKGGLPTSVGFIFDENLFLAVNKECMQIVPQVNLNNPNQIYEFYLFPRDMKTFKEQNITITPKLIFPDKDIILADSAINIKIESAFWVLVSQSYLLIAGGTVSLSFFLVQVLASLRRNDT